MEHQALLEVRYSRNGEALLQHVASELCAIGGASTDPAVSMPGYEAVDTLQPNNCGFLSQARVVLLSQYAFGVRLVDKGKGEAQSSNALAIQALRNDTTWHNGATFTSTDDTQWCFEKNCPTNIKHWPNMYHSCGRPDCVHWMVSTTHASTATRPPVASFTWLIMNPATENISFVAAKIETKKGVDDGVTDKASDNQAALTLTGDACRVAGLTCLQFGLVIGIPLLCSICLACCVFAACCRTKQQQKDAAQCFGNDTQQFNKTSGFGDGSTVMVMASAHPSNMATSTNPLSGVEAMEPEPYDTVYTSSSYSRSHHVSLPQAWSHSLPAATSSSQQSQ